MHVVERIVLGKENESKWNVCFFSYFFLYYRWFLKSSVWSFKGIVHSKLLHHLLIIMSKPDFLLWNTIKICVRILGTKEFWWLNSTRKKTCLWSTKESQPCRDVFHSQWRNKLIIYHILWSIAGETNQLLVTVSWNSSMVAPLLFQQCKTMTSHGVD